MHNVGCSNNYCPLLKMRNRNNYKADTLKKTPATNQGHHTLILVTFIRRSLREVYMFQHAQNSSWINFLLNPWLILNYQGHQPLNKIEVRMECQDDDSFFPFLPLYFHSYYRSKHINNSKSGNNNIRRCLNFQHLHKVAIIWHLKPRNGRYGSIIYVVGEFPVGKIKVKHFSPPSILTQTWDGVILICITTRGDSRQKYDHATNKLPCTVKKDFTSGSG